MSPDAIGVEEDALKEYLLTPGWPKQGSFVPEVSYTASAVTTTTTDLGSVRFPASGTNDAQHSFGSSMATVSNRAVSNFRRSSSPAG